MRALLALGLALLLAVSISAQDYEPENAMFSLTVAVASYCTGGQGFGVNDWSCPACKKLPDVTNPVEFTNRTTNINGFIARSPNTPSDPSPVVLIAFAGTDPKSLKNWMDDFDTLATDYPLCDDCKVHAGFYDSYLSVRDQVLSLLEEYMASTPKARIRVTGHSLGAAVAVHCALDIAVNLPYELDTFFTFGQPRVGYQKFSEFLVSKVPLWRVTHWRDPVPHLPPAMIGFVHPPTEVFYVEDNSSYTLCTGAEDPQCSDQFYAALYVTDHLTYLGYPMDGDIYPCRFNPVLTAADGSTAMTQ